MFNLEKNSLEAVQNGGQIKQSAPVLIKVVAEKVRTMKFTAVNVGFEWRNMAK